MHYQDALRKWGVGRLVEYSQRKDRVFDVAQVDVFDSGDADDDGHWDFLEVRGVDQDGMEYRARVDTGEFIRLLEEVLQSAGGSLES